MQFPAIVLNSGVRGKLVVLLFLVAWLFGSVALTASFESDAHFAGTCIFAIACGLWWISYKICLSANGKGMTLGLVALGMWMLNLGGMLLVDFHHAVTGFLFWASTAVLLLLVTAVALSHTPSDAHGASPRPD
jgi:hypothetical protein